MCFLAVVNNPMKVLKHDIWWSPIEKSHWNKRRVEKQPTLKERHSYQSTACAIEIWNGLFVTRKQDYSDQFIISLIWNKKFYLSELAWQLANGKCSMSNEWIHKFATERPS